ncbi:hypothetical protein BJ912DRAFT_15628 [Pholiota molesta]|nr:hypothetical protein BJ912DRAFT_15628 [Pholiota molesta]
MTVNWSNSQEISKDLSVFHELVFVLFGAYLWEVLVTWDFEWSLLTRRRNFRWPLVTFFFLCRYCMLLAFLGLIISFSITEEINCRVSKALNTFNSWTGNMSILCASTSLMLRTIALWERRKSIIAILGTLCLAHWGLLYRTMFVVVSEWDSAANACVVVQTDPSMLNTTFFFTMGFDFIILVFTAVALLSRHSIRTDLWKLLFQDGLVYFLASFSTNCIPAVLNVINLNTPMNVIGTIPAATVTSIAACRAVMRLLDFNSNDVYIHSMSGGGSNPPITHNMPSHLKAQKLGLARPEVRVVTEHITMTEFPASGTCSAYTKNEHHIGSTCTDTQSMRDLEALSDKASFEFPPQ